MDKLKIFEELLNALREEIEGITLHSKGSPANLDPLLRLMNKVGLLETAIKHEPQLIPNVIEGLLGLSMNIDMTTTGQRLRDALSQLIDMETEIVGY